MVRKSLGIMAVLSVWSVVTPAPVFALDEVTVADGYQNILDQGLIFANICDVPAPETREDIDPCDCRARGLCSLAEVIQIFVNIIIFILGIAGSVALIMFVYAGWLWVFAQGRPDHVQDGKDTMKHAAIGLAIVFGAYAAINFVIAFIGGVTPGATLEETIGDLDVTGEGEVVDIPTEGMIETSTP